jgi:hypothetical protein
MLTPLTPHERSEMQPMSGPGGSSGKKRKDLDSLRAEQAIDWSKVETRFDAARELLKQSLLGLDEDQEYAVVLFGTTAEPLTSTRDYVKAEENKLRVTFTELDDIEDWSDQLRGYTNIHGAFRDAFEMATKKSKKVSEKGHVDVATNHWAVGCDTILLLSDGAPTYDDWAEVAEGGPRPTHDHEKGESGGMNTEWVEVGPFEEPDYLLADVERWNLLRGCTIHCVGLGESDDDLLQRLARIGNGTVLRIGKD